MSKSPKSLLARHPNGNAVPLVSGNREAVSPDNRLPENVSLENVLPDDAVPESAMPGNAMPGSAMPDGAMPENAFSGGGLPAKRMPGNRLPRPVSPDDAARSDRALPATKVARARTMPAGPKGAAAAQMMEKPQRVRRKAGRKQEAPTGDAIAHDAASGTNRPDDLSPPAPSPEGNMQETARPEHGWPPVHWPLPADAQAATRLAEDITAFWRDHASELESTFRPLAMRPADEAAKPPANATTATKTTKRNKADAAAGVPACTARSETTRADAANPYIAALSSATLETPNVAIRIIDTPEALALIACIGGNSPFLSDLVRGNPIPFARILAHGPTCMADEAISALAQIDITLDRADIAQALRITRQHVALAAAIGDLGGLWSLEDVTRTLSRLADTALDVGVRHLLRAAHDRGRLSLRDQERPARGSGYIVLAMGKLGARELNFSSDIDLMALYDPECHAAPDEVRQIFIRMTSDLVRLLEARDANGYVFRTDLRLRPDPGATPLAVSLSAATSYYESIGQTWERAAMTKARAVAGDLTAGRRFLASIHPFIWRRHLDFALIDDIHDMKVKIDRHRAAANTRLAAPVAAGTQDITALPDATLNDPEAAARLLLGHNIKLGQGGIREIEFIAQAMQLIWGGRSPVLRERTTIGALRGLARSGHIPREEAETLSRAYRRLREIEHRLQMRDDRQTHSLPDSLAGLDALAIFLGLSGADALALELLPQMRATRRIFDRHFATPLGSDAAPAEISDVTAEDLPDRLVAFGFPAAHAETAATLMRGWNGNAARALRSERAHALLRALLPALLNACIARRDPLACLRHFDTLLHRQRAGVQLLSLFTHNPALLERIATIFDASSFLANHLADTPSALEGLLEPEEDAESTTQAVIRKIQGVTEESDSTEILVTRLRPLVRGEQFRLSVAQLEGRMEEDAVEKGRTDLADGVIEAVFTAAHAEIRTRHGTVRGGGMVVVALGKAGSREMMAGSDLDLMLIFDHPADTTTSQPLGVTNTPRAGRPNEGNPGSDSHGAGPQAAASGQPRGRSRSATNPAPQDRPAGGLSESTPASAPDAGSVERVTPIVGRALPVAQYYLRLAHLVVAALTAPDAEGPLYAVDMRLRPSGAAGPVAVSRRAFLHYHESSSWTWERMALTRARIVTGSNTLRRALRRDIDAVLDGTGAVPAARILADAAAMRARLARDLPPTSPWDIRRRAGGLMELEFIAQSLQLVAASGTARDPRTVRALTRLGHNGMLSREDARSLITIDREWRRLQGALRLLCGPVPPQDPQKDLPPATLEILLRETQAPDCAALAERVEQHAATVQELFRKRVIEPGVAAIGVAMSGTPPSAG